MRDWRGVYDRWGLRCCSPGEFRLWFEEGGGGNMDEFCSSAVQEWCLGKIERGECVKGTLPPAAEKGEK